MVFSASLTLNGNHTTWEMTTLLTIEVLNLITTVIVHKNNRLSETNKSAIIA
jgi:hypothetical protein